ncbi:DNA-processing protein DprA [Chryseobacterium sp. SIMBA_028]|uniref:DNA-processing protein DprA n=2 Tax=unclassified Chryseobacterium TaxID=2593645 RepID=UPI00397CBA86
MNQHPYHTYYSNLTPIEKKSSPRELFFKGDFSLLENGRRVSVVGSRKVSDLGVRRARKISKFLVENNITVVSGLAEGVDATAHKTAIELGGHTIAVIGTPLDKYFPAANKNLQGIIAKDHLLISQFPVGYPTTNKDFPIRNRTMALISDATIIIEANEKSGTRHQGWEALRLGRELFIMENVINENISWAKEMLNYGAQILTNDNYDDLILDIPYLTAKADYAF